MSGANLEPISEAQKRYACNLFGKNILPIYSQEGTVFTQSEFENVIGKTLDEMNKGEGSFIISTLLGNVKPYPYCKCGQLALVKINFSFHGNKAFKEVYTGEIDLCMDCADKIKSVILEEAPNV